eukprot:10295532-Ditylum_brightwellii.AAC.1
MANLSESNTELANQVIDMANQLKKKDSDMDAMRKSINDLTPVLQDLKHGADTSAGLGLAQSTRKYEKEATINSKVGGSTEVPRVRTD